MRRILLFTFGFLTLSTAQALAQIAPEIDNVNLIDMPNARMNPDGQLALGAEFFQNTQRYNFDFQALPWLDATFVYSGLTHFDPAFPVYWDRSLQVKARLWDETDIVPAVALGINDVIGTAVFGSEYLVASKQFGKVDTALGIGWGTLGSTGIFRNPLALISNAFATRPTFGTPGGVSFAAFFHGPTSGLFGGITWQTPIDGLSLMAEYSSDEYTLEASRGNFKPINQFNYAATYKATDTLDLSLEWLYGRSLGASFSFQLDPTKDPFEQRIGPQPPAPFIRSSQEQQKALASLLALREGGISQRASQLRTIQASDAMVDAVWLNAKGINDITADGHTLLIRVLSGDINAICRSTAEIVARYSHDINQISISDNRRTTHCAVPATSPFALVDNRGQIDLDTLALNDSVIVTGDVMTIPADTSSEVSNRNAITKIKADASAQQLIIQAIAADNAELTVYYSNTHYFSELDAIRRLTRILMADAPPEIEKFNLIATLGGEPQQAFEVLRGPAERSFTQSGDMNFLTDVSISPPSMQNPILTAGERGTYPRFSWSLFPQFRQELFDPSNPFGVQLLAGAESTLEILPGLSLTGEVEANIYDDFNVSRLPDSALPHVRTDFLEYFTKGKNGIGDLEADYRFRLAPNVFAVAKAGYLESMFAGVGGEVLWRPEGQRWALGADLYDVHQRDFNRLFGLQNYHITTGHISVYYASPWYGLNFAVRAGQYLAGDRGLTFEATRRFSTGIEIGAFFTRTNVSAAQFGEGSFDKGFIIRIPIDWMLPLQTQTEWDTIIRPVQRDGGQRLDGDATLYDETRRSSIGEIYNDLEESTPQ